ncbi:MAG: hypothetical protein JKY37_31815 [Nannocystaceae bacterium]|nr:hypothetical protein [Nannocystaceae bacterium]
MSFRDLILGLGIVGLCGPLLAACGDDTSSDGGNDTTSASTSTQGSMATTTTTSTAAESSSDGPSVQDSTGANSSGDTSGDTSGGTEGDTASSSGSTDASAGTDESSSDSTSGGFEVEGCNSCNAGEVCRGNFSFQSEYECVPIPKTCVGKANCDCAASLCVDPFVACDEPPHDNAISCICIAC